MTTQDTTRQVRMTLPKITLAMMICGIVSAAGIGAASAATADDSAPSLTVKYDPMALQSDNGARQLYRRLEAAANELCPQFASDGHLVSSVTQQCRKQALARAVMQINNPRLVAVYRSNIGNG
jgi:UrcA family protein